MKIVEYLQLSILNEFPEVTRGGGESGVTKSACQWIASFAPFLSVSRWSGWDVFGRTSFALLRPVVNAYAGSIPAADFLFQPTR